MKMKKSLKIKFGLVAALSLGFLISVGSLFGINFARADRTVTVSGSSIFVTSANAQVWAHRVGEGDDAVDHTMFVFSDDEDAINYRKNLAYNWIENKAVQESDKDEGDGSDGDSGNEGSGSDGGSEGEEEKPAPEIKFESREGWFNMEIGFDDDGNKNGVVFDKFVLTFESQQYAETKAGKTVNYIVFENDKTTGKVNVYTIEKGKDDEELEDTFARLGTSLGALDTDHIKISFTASSFGEYTVHFANVDADGAETATTTDGKFINIGKTYSRYSSSSTTPITPLSFKALFPKEESAAEGDDKENAYMTLYNLNGQSFKLSNTTESNGHRTGGTVNDVTPPVLCLDKAVPFIKLNDEITFDYTVIDVLTSSPSMTTSYYMLTKEDVANGKAPVYKEDGGDYKKVTESDDQYIFPHTKHYLPAAGDLTGTKFLNDDDLKAVAAIKVVLKLTDTTSNNGQSTYVLLDWFVEDNLLIHLDGDTTNDPAKTYIAVASDKRGAKYAYTDDASKTSTPDLNSNTDWNSKVEAYQDKVTEAAKGLKAGNKNYFYLPDAHELLDDNSTAYQDMKFSIYYNDGSQQQNNNKKSNELSINIKKSGKYVFTIYANDAADNKMYYYDAQNKKVEFETSEIWDMYKQEKDTKFEDMRKYLPWFEFTVDELELTIEDPETQDTAYVGSSFTPDNFEINGVSVNTVYTLYQFENELWAKDHGGVAMTYAEFEEQQDTLLKTARQYFTRIRPTSDLKEGTEEYDKFNPYGWNGSSLSFTPQVANAFYLIRCEASSSEAAEPVTKCMAIAAAPRVKALAGEDTWLQDNMVSIILLSIAGASLVGIVLLLVIKPKKKTDVDEAPAPKKRRSV